MTGLDDSDSGGSGDDRLEDEEFHHYSDQVEWYVVYCRSRAEKKVLELINTKINTDMLTDIEPFLPLQKVKSRWSDRVKEIDKPLFPGYLFIRTRLTNYTWRELIVTPGIVKLLHQGDKPLPISQRDIDVIKQLLHSGMPLTTASLFKQGQHVIVKKGPLQGVDGILSQINPKTYKLVVNFNLLGRSVRTTIDPWDVEPA